VPSSEWCREGESDDSEGQPNPERCGVGRLDFLTSAGALDGPGARSALGLLGRGVTTVITDLGVLTLDEQAGELCLTAVHEGVAVPDVVAATGWPLRVSASVSVEPPPTATELTALRELLAAGPSPA
jgi:glutaconate CoA-transferase subunit B